MRRHLPSEPHGPVPSWKWIYAARFAAVRPVKAKVMQIENITEVEYEEKLYRLSKDFPFKLRDVVKVRLIEGEETCYLA